MGLYGRQWVKNPFYLMFLLCSCNRWCI